jgi:hypothetical protein
VESARQMILGCQDSQIEPVTLQEISGVSQAGDLPYV